MLAARNWAPVRRRDFTWFAIFTDPFSGRQPLGHIKAAARIIYNDDKLAVSRCGLNRVAHGNTRLLGRQKQFLLMSEFQARWQNKVLFSGAVNQVSRSGV
jgi:hypothetical protein